MSKRIITILAIVAVLALSAAPAFAGSSTGVTADITAHVKGQDLPLYSISIVSGGSLTYNQLGGSTVEVAKKGETLGADQDLVVTNNGSEQVDVAVTTNDDSPHTAGYAKYFILGPNESDQTTYSNTGVWEFAQIDGQGVPGTFYTAWGNYHGHNFGTLASGSTTSFASRVMLPTELPLDAPSTYTWSGLVVATAAQ